MAEKSFKTSTILGFIEVVLMMISAPLSRIWYNSWGATREEATKPLPGDDLVPRPRLSYTRAIDINKSKNRVWPWLVQIGQGRGGLYSYDGLENLVGCEIYSADRILPEYQDIKVGDLVLFGPAEKKFPGQVVMEVQPERAIVMCGLDPVTREAVTSATWVFILEDINEQQTRLIVRGRNDYPPTFGMHVLWHIIEPINFVMERKMLRGIKARAENE